MAWIEVLPTDAPRAGAKPFVERPGYVAYKLSPIPDAVPAVIPAVIQKAVPEPVAIAVSIPKPEPILNNQLDWWDSFWRDRARNKLQRTLARIIQISQDHEANGVTPGDPIYQNLYFKALDLCHQYFDRWHLNRDNIEVEIPCMRQLRLAAKPEATITARKAPAALFGLLALVALPLITGAWCGLFGVGQAWIKHLFGG
jgi:hypothetical protein